MNDKLSKIQGLIGPITEDQMRYVDAFIGDHLGLFMPIAGPCFYAVIPEHTHPSYMVVLPFDDNTQICNKRDTTRISPNQIIIFSPNIPHQEVYSDSPPRYIAAFIEKSFFERQLRSYPLQGEIEFHGETYPISGQLFQLMREFIMECENDLPASHLILNAITVRICHLLIRSIFYFPLADTDISDRLEIIRTIQYIHIHLQKKITIEMLADKANTSESHFARIFKQETGTSPINYVIEARLDMAKKLLQLGEKSITEIALECGFNSSSYFSTTFMNKTGMSPSKYQRLYKKGRISK